jgi:hypothetical protein
MGLEIDKRGDVKGMIGQEGPWGLSGTWALFAHGDTRLQRNRLQGGAPHE